MKKLLDFSFPKTVLNRLSGLFALYCLWVISTARLEAQTLFVDTMQYAPQEIVNDFFNGGCVTVSSVEFIGQPRQLTFFEGSQSGLGVNAGILFTTGESSAAVGPNDQDGKSAGYGAPASDSLMQSITTGSIFDLSMLHMTIVPHIDSIGFQYVFGSEEYCEYVNTQFNDAFGFWIKGPGISGTFPQNIALVPGTNTPVAINNVNFAENAAYYINNTPASGNLCGIPFDSAKPTMQSVQYDGLLKVLTASAHVVPGETYEVWIGITDVGDGVWDSGIFLSAESLCGDSLLSPVAGFATNNIGTTVKFANTTKYATSWHWDFGDGTTSEERYPSHTYVSLDQAYTVRLIAQNWCCSDTTYYTVGATGVKEQNLDAFRISPTLFNDQLSIVPPGDFPNGSIILSDISGQIMLSRDFNGETVLRTAQLPRGIYFLKIQSGGLEKTWKLMK